MVRSMAGDRRGTTLRVDANGVRVQRLSGVRGGVWIAVLAIAIACGVLLLLVRPGRLHEPPERAARGAPPAPEPRVAANDVRAPARPIAPAVAPPKPPPLVPAVPAAGSAEPPVPDGDAAQPPSPDNPVFGEAHPGERTGIAVFPPPGTKPIKRGIVVPDDFELPAGYVRHYQATDDGERVPAILMFHPDYHPVDAHGEPIALPADRVVPPEMAPPGMPIQILELPEGPDAPDAPDAAP